MGTHANVCPTFYVDRSVIAALANKIMQLADLDAACSRLCLLVGCDPLARGQAFHLTGRCDGAGRLSRCGEQQPA